MEERNQLCGVVYALRYTSTRPCLRGCCGVGAGRGAEAGRGGECNVITSLGIISIMYVYACVIYCINTIAHTFELCTCTMYKPGAGLPRKS